MQFDISIRGTPEYPRYLIENKDGEFWDGEKFVSDETDGLLYHHFSPASLVARQLMLESTEATNTYSYVVPLQITVKANEEPDVRSVINWLYKAMTIDMDYDLCGRGPVEDSVGTTIIEWEQLKKVSMNYGQ